MSAREAQRQQGIASIDTTNRPRKKPREPGAGKPRTTTLSTDVYLQLRVDVLSGKLQPGERLRAEMLRQRFGIASSPIREALNRLVSEGFVSLTDQKGFRVAPVSEDELRELVLARCWIDGAAITQAIRRHDVAWEESLVLALHRLSRADRNSPAASADTRADWERLHREFHLALVSGCGSVWIRRISAQLFDSAERYRLLAADEIPRNNELDQHRAIVDACLAGQTQQAVQLLEEHYGQTMAVIMGSAAAQNRLSG